MENRYDVIRSISMAIMAVVLGLLVASFIANDATLPGWIVLVALGSLIGINIVNLQFPRPMGMPLIDQHAESVRKRKNDQMADLDPLDVLTDDDIAELRAEMKDRLRRLMHDGDTESMTTFESLLAEREHRARK